MTKNKDLAYKSGLMEPSMKESGITMQLRAQEDFATQMATLMKVNGSTTRLMALVFTITKMAPHTWEIGKMTCRMDQERKLGLMAQCSRANTSVA